MGKERNANNILILMVIFPIITAAFIKRKKVKKLMIHSKEAEKHNIKLNPSPIIIRNGIHLYNKILHPMERKLKGTIVINSWYRSPELNQMVGGVPNSKHLEGKAIDFTYFDEGGNINFMEALNFLAPFQLSELIRYPQHIHIAL
jgi:hypothetical protein